MFRVFLISPYSFTSTVHLPFGFHVPSVCNYFLKRVEVLITWNGKVGGNWGIIQGKFYREPINMAKTFP